LKVDLKRELKHLYSATRDPAMLDVPAMPFLMVDGHGDPNTAPAYAAAVEALYTVAYTVKFAVRRAPGEFDFGVMPMEGLWWVPDMASFSVSKKEDWDWTMMIMQPEQVTEAVFREAAAAALKKKPGLPAIANIRLEHFTEGRAAQLLYTGPYSAEGPTIARLHEFIAEQGCVRSGKHHEIYLSDARRTAPDKLKTIIRQPVTATAGRTPG
jgi:hypothetical protein